MPTNHQKPAAQAPASPRNTSKYTNKDGSKFITVPKGAAAESSQPSTPTSNKPSESFPESTSQNSPLQTVNRKKQKRRQKAAAKAAAEQQMVNGHANRPSHPHHQPSRLEPADYEEVNSEDEEVYEYLAAHEAANGHSQQPLKSKKAKKKKKKKASSGTDENVALSTRVRSPSGQARGSGMSRDKIWSTSNQEERERIKEFWLGLGEDERKSLVKVEKDAVLKKMKEQQKHTCSCTVCGRKRTAIEEELETLYDAYYVELEQFANQGEGPPILASTRDFSSHPFRNIHSQYAPQPPSHARIVEHVGEEEEDDDLEEVYSEDEVDDEDYSDDEPPEEYHNPQDRDVADFLTFGNSLQVKGTQLLESLLHRYGNMDLGGILTVADDLLKNDGKRFIEMMEQLAERRMAREEDAREHFSRGYGHPNGSYSNPHNHPSPEDDDYEEEEEEEEDYDDSQDEEYEDEEDPMTEEQRMEEGRRMFQIFAARMFEQRVLSAYKEKVAKERQAKLIEELEEEDRKEDEQKAKKAKNAQKKKEKAAQKKQAAAEEKARKEAEKAAEEAARLESEQKRASEQRRKAEEKRKQKEAQKKAEEEARLKKEADRQRRIHDQREKQAEHERKAREAKEREKKLKEDQRLKEKEVREQKEREALERREKQERDKREKEARAAKAQREAQDAREKAKEEKAKEDAIPSKPLSGQPSHTSPHQPQLSPSISKRTQQPPISVPTILPQHPPNPSAFASPKVPVATPTLSKVPTPIRPRTLSQQLDMTHLSSTTSQSGSGASQNPSPHPDSTAHSSPRPIGQQRKESLSFTGPLPPTTQSSSPHSVQSSRPSISTPVQGLLPLAMQPPPGLAHHPPPPGFPSRIGHEQMLPPGFRPGPNMMIPPPGINGPAGRGFSPVPMPPPGFAQAPDFPIGQAFPMPKDPSPPHHTHIRQGSSGYDSISSAPAQPIGRPAPIGRPGTIAQGRSGEDKDDETQHLGSRALLGDDEPIAPDVGPPSLRNQPPGPRQAFGPNPFLDTSFGLNHNPWGPPSGAGHHFPPPPGLSGPTWGPPGIPPAFAMPTPASAMSPIRSNPSGSLHLRPLLVQLYKDLSNTPHVDGEGYINLHLFKVHLEAQQGEAPHDQELFEYLESDNGSGIGGGKFDVRVAHGGPSVRWTPANDVPSPQQSWSLGGAGSLGSPVAGPASLRGI